MEKLSTVFRKIRIFILDTLFPIKCIGCQKEEVWLCDTCLSRVTIQTEHVCGICEKMITPDGRTCHACKKKNALDGLIVATSYTNSFVSQAIHFYKYRFIPDLHVSLGNLLVKAFQKTDIPLPDIIIPIPLHSRRLRWRGFNQTELLAKHVSLNLLPNSQIDLEEKILVRKKYTPPQMKISNYQHRKQNIQGAFYVTDSEKIKNKTVLLVDDVATTGSTIFECAQILKDSGAKEIYAAVIARQEIKNSGKY
jgi:ComF family protein